MTGLFFLWMRIEKIYSRITGIIQLHEKYSFTFKTTLMISRKIINRLIILAFFVLIGYCLATSIAVRSGIGIFLAIVSLGAGVTCLYLLAKRQQEADAEESY
jgi:hypothetical protein